MAPAFAVGDPESILGDACGLRFRAELLRLLGVEPPRDSRPAFYTALLPVTSWSDLLDRVEAEMGDGRSPHLWALRDNRGAFLEELPLGAKPITISFSDQKSLVCTSRAGVKQELMRFARALELPVTERPVNEYFMRDVYKEDEGYDICAYCQLMLALIESERRGQPVWLV